MNEQNKETEESRIKSEKQYLAAVNTRAFEREMSALSADYPPSEIHSWERQRAEALGWEADNTIQTPWIDIAAQARGMDRVEYLQRTAAKAHQFARASAWLIGRRHAISDAIEAAQSLDDLSDITLSYSPAAQDEN